MFSRTCPANYFPGTSRHHAVQLHRQWSVPIVIVMMALRIVWRRERIEIIRLGRRWSRQTDDNGGVNSARQLLEPSMQSTAQYPCQQSQQEIDGSDEKPKGVLVNISIKVIQSRRFQFECFNLPRLHDGLHVLRCFALLVRDSGFQQWPSAASRIRSMTAFPPVLCANTPAPLPCYCGQDSPGQTVRGSPPSLPVLPTHNGSYATRRL